MDRKNAPNYSNLLHSTGKKQGSGHAILAALLVLIVVMWLAAFPLPIYEEYEAAKGTSEGFDIWGDDEAVKEKHAEMIALTQELYNKRRDELIEEFTDPNSEVSRAVKARCQSILANDYAGYTLGSISWNIPEKDYTLSAHEADTLLYLYSCQFDWDFLNGSIENYVKWLYGFEGTSSPYTAEGLGTTFTLSGRRGYYMEQDDLNEARRLARQAGRKAYREATMKNIGGEVLAFVSGPFVDVAYAAGNGGEDPEAMKRQAYEATLDDYAMKHGRGGLDQFIFTGISDQMQGEISFTASGTPYYESGLIKVEEFGTSEAAGEVAGALANPMFTRIEVIEADNEWEETRKSEPCSWRNDGYDKNGNIIWTAYEWNKYKHSEHYVGVRCFAITPSINFTATANVNASGVPAY